MDITPAQRKILQSLIERHLPNIAIWAYGSRVKGASRPASDLDLVVFSPPELAGQVSRLREALEESSLPFRVDLFIWDEVPERFRRAIEQEHVALSESSVTNHGGDVANE